METPQYIIDIRIKAAKLEALMTGSFCARRLREIAAKLQNNKPLIVTDKELLKHYNLNAK